MDLPFDASLKRVATQLVEYCKAGETAKGLDELYAPDAVSVEALEMGDQPREVRGVDAIKAKHDWWYNQMDVHESTTEGPFMFGDDKFGAIFWMDVTDKSSGHRMQAKELGVYTVADGRIVREEFYYQGG